MIHDSRVQLLNDQPVRRGDFVLYWMQQSQRATWNHALEYAIRQANELKQPLVVLFGLTGRFPEANARHYRFMLEGLRETRRALRERGIQLVARHGSPERVAAEMAEAASLVVADRGHLRVQRQWREHVAKRARCRVVQVESDVVVPVDVASDKEEYAARTIRPRIHRHLAEFLVPLSETPVRRDSLGLGLDGLDLTDIGAILGGLRVDRGVAATPAYIGGTAEAERLLDGFTQGKLARYAELRGEPALDYTSHLAPYLHFGQISALRVASEVSRHEGGGRDAFLEELIVRRELSMNFVERNARYDSYEALPDWARATLAKHAGDAREVVYSLEELESGQTHDPYWNAAQREMVIRGKMHNTMRMYWGKKLIEWSPTPGEAFQRALYLNNKYELDGRDANSFAGVAWCFGKHDRPWKERPVFGTVRYMNARGLERKYDMEAYLARTNALDPG